MVAGAAFLGPIGSIIGTGDAPPAASPSPGVTTSPESTTTTTPALTLGPDVLLDAADLVPEDGGWQAIDTPWAGEGPVACAEGGSEDAADVLLRSFVPSDEGRVDQVIERYASPGDAEARFDEIRGAVAECAAGLDIATGGPPEFWNLSGVGDSAWIAGYWTPETRGEQRRRVEIGLVWTGTAVAHVTWGFLAQDSTEPAVTPVVVAATEKLCGAAAGTCVSGAALEPDTGPWEPAP